MKKENGLKRTWQHFTKRASTLILAGAVAISILPMAVSAADETGGTKFWQTINHIKASDFAEVFYGAHGRFISADPDTITSTNGKYTAERLLGDDGVYPGLSAYHNGAAGLTTRGRNGDWSAKLKEGGLVDDAYSAWLGDGQYSAFMIRHAWNRDGLGQGFAWSDPSAGIRFGGIYADVAGDIQVGDKIRITAKVFPTETGIYTHDSTNNWTWLNNKNNFLDGSDTSAKLNDVDKTLAEEYPTPPKTETISLWLSGTGYAASAPEEGKPYTTMNVTFDQWNDVELEYTVTEDNKNVDSVKIDAKDRTIGTLACHYPAAITTYYGGVKVERYTSPGGSYTFQNGKKWEQLSQVTMDDYKEVEGSSGGISWWGGKKSDNTGWLSAEAGSGKYAEFKTNYGHQRIHQGTGIRPISGEGGVTAPAIPGAGAITKVFKLNRAWSQQSGSWNAGMGKGAPDSRINISGLFDKTKVQVGDTVKITAWVMGLEMHDATTAADSMKPDDAATVTMWLSDKARSGDVATNGPAADYNLAKPANASETASYDDMKQGVWKEISLTYTVTEENKDVTGIGLNSDKMGSDKVAAFPLYLYVAGVKAEKLVDDPTQTAGTVSGTITAQIDDAAGTKIVVAAYQGNELLGCDIVDADAATTKYSFSIADASGTDKVIAYIWKLDNANPVLAPIPLTAN